MRPTSAGVIGPGIGPSQHGRERERVVALDVRVLAEETSEVVVRLGRALDPGEDPRRGRVVALEDVAPDAGEHDAMEAVRGSDRRPQQRQRAEREPDRVDRVVGERGDDPGGQVGVLRRVVRLGRGTVAEQVDADHLAAGVGQQGGEAAALPRRRERAAPPVHEDHRDRHGPAA